ncbi:hypothetical protein EMEDMD4_1160014 [Sinorhizobium medicae]|uniref:Uncharacterized protein n=1 Tax=Sinorhizobium medicae TaxID=110321 RepID=A0A508WVE7_9HYPH|nr:hypothetical protein EMEDMD4_1160014 [Sinorhizobium medicae]
MNCCASYSFCTHGQRISAMLCRSAGDSIFGENGSHMGVTVNAHLFLDRRPKILDEMKTVSHLAGLRCALPGCLGIQTAANSANDLDSRTLLQPCSLRSRRCGSSKTSTTE